MARNVNSPEAGSSGIQSVARALGVLELFTERRPTLTTSEIATLTGLNRATAYRFCHTLLDLGYLDEVSPSTFRPGPRAVALAQAALVSQKLPDVARPLLRELRATTGETVNMALRDAGEIVYVARLLNDDLLALRLFVGSRLPIYTASLGRAILAFLSPPEIDELLDTRAPQQLTPFTITDRRRLLAELRDIREQGYALNEQEVVLGVRGIAAPVFGPSGRPVAAINLSLARACDADEVASTLAPAVVATATAIAALAARSG